MVLQIRMLKLFFVYFEHVLKNKWNYIFEIYEIQEENSIHTILYILYAMHLSK